MRHRKFASILAASLMTVSVPAFAQPSSLATPGSLPAAAGDPSLAAKMIDVELPATNVRDFVDYLQRASGVNIILFNDPNVDPSRITVPQMKLKQMPATTAIDLLSALPGANITVEQRDGSSYLVTVHSPDGPGFAGSGGPGGAAPAERPATKVFSLEQVFFGTSGLNERSPDSAERTRVLTEKVPQALKLIEEALSLDADHPNEQAIVKLHEGTNTLIVRGRPGQLATVEEVLRALAPPVPSDEAKAYAARLQEIQMKSDQEQMILKTELEARRAALPRYENEIAALRGDLAIAEKRLRAAGEAKPAAPTTQP